MRLGELVFSTVFAICAVSTIICVSWCLYYIIKIRTIPTLTGLQEFLGRDFPKFMKVIGLIALITCVILLAMIIYRGRVM